MRHAGPGSGLPLSFLNWAYVRHGVYFWLMVRRVIDFRRFRTPTLQIFGVILGLLAVMLNLGLGFGLRLELCGLVNNVARPADS